MFSCSGLQTFFVTIWLIDMCSSVLARKKIKRLIKAVLQSNRLVSSCIYVETESQCALLIFGTFYPDLFPFTCNVEYTYHSKHAKRFGRFYNGPHFLQNSTF